MTLLANNPYSCSAYGSSTYGQCTQTAPTPSESSSNTSNNGSNNTSTSPSTATPSDTPTTSTPETPATSTPGTPSQTTTQPPKSTPGIEQAAQGTNFLPLLLMGVVFLVVLGLSIFGLWKRFGKRKPPNYTGNGGLPPPQGPIGTSGGPTPPTSL